MPWPGELRFTLNEAHIGIYTVRPNNIVLVAASLDLLTLSSIMGSNSAQLRFNCCPSGM